MQTSGRPVFRNASRGFNLIEAAIVLGVVGLIIGGVFVVWASIDTGNKIRRATEEITIIVNTVRNNYSNRATMEVGDITAGIVAGEMVPRAYISGANILTPWTGPGQGQGLTVEGISAGSRFRISVNNVGPREHCFALATSVLAAAKTNGLRNIGGVNVGPTSTSATNGTMCPAGAATNLTFEFLLRND
jgi:hypothetical protein